MNSTNAARAYYARAKYQEGLSALAARRRINARPLSRPERLQSIPGRSIRVYFADGQTLETSINGSEVEIAEYYVGNEFNLGRGGDDYITRAIEVEFLPSEI